MIGGLWLTFHPAASFYDFTPILIAQDQSLQRLATILEKTQADTLIAGGGSVSLKDLLKQYNGLKQVIWVVARSSRHVDWNEVSEGEGGKAEISTWHDIVDEQSDSASAELPAHESSSQAPNVTLVSEPTDKINDYTIVEFTQKVCPFVLIHYFPARLLTGHARTSSQQSQPN